MRSLLNRHNNRSGNRSTTVECSLNSVRTSSRNSDRRSISIDSNTILVPIVRNRLVIVCSRLSRINISIQGSRTTFADSGVVSRDSDRSRSIDTDVVSHHHLALNHSYRAGEVRDTTFVADNASRNDVRTSLSRGNHSRSVLTRNLNTINIPSDIRIVRNMVENNRDILASTNRVNRNDDDRSCRTRVHIDRNLTGSSASTALRDDGSSHMVSGGGVGLDINRGSRAVASLSIPLISHITLPTILIDIQCGVFALTDVRSGSTHKQVSTEGLNREVLRSQVTTLSGGQSNIVNTSGDSQSCTLSTVVPSEGTRNVRVSSQSSAVSHAKHIVASDRNSRRSGFNSHHDRLGSESGNTTLVADSLGGNAVSTILIVVDGQVSLILTRNLNTVLIPDVSGGRGVASSVEAHLVTLTNRGGSRSVNSELSRQRVDDDRHLTLSGARTALSNNSSRHMISGGSGGLDINRGSRAVASLSIPSVSHIALPAVLINIQSGMFALTDAGSRSAHQDISTEGFNREVLRSQVTTLSGGDSNIVNTSSNRHGSTLVTVVPSEGTRNVRMSGQSSAVGHAKHIVASDRNSRRSGFNSHHDRLGSESGNTTLVADSLGGNAVSTILIVVDGQVSLILTNNLNTVLVPNVSGGRGVASSMERHLVALTNGSRSSGSHRKLCRQRVDNDRHFTLDGASTVRGRNSSSHMIGGRLIRLNVNRRSNAVTSLFVPEISDIALPSFLINIQRGMFTLTDAGSRSADNEVSTEGLNIEVLRSQLTAFRSNDGNIVRTSRNIDGGSGVTGGPHKDTLNIRVSSQSGNGILTKDIHTSDRNLSRSRINRHSDRLRSLSGDTTLIADSLSSEGVGASFVEVDRNDILVLTRNFNTVLVPNVAGNLRINRSSEGNLVAFADQSGGRSNGERSRQLVNDDRNLAFSRTRTVGRRNRCSHMISGRAVGLDVNSGSRAVVSLSIPLISDITLPTILIDIQSGVLTAADAGSGSAH